MKPTTILLCLPIVMSAFGCSKESNPPGAAAASGEETAASSSGDAPKTASAELQTAPGVSLTGKGVFSVEPGGVRARVTVADAKPGQHGIHIHEKGDCSDIPGKSMGSHFAPDSKQHGLLHSPDRHLGDLGNIEVAADGSGSIDVLVAKATLDGGSHSYVGKALVIHEKEDVGTGDSGESGTPIACAVIRTP